MVKAAARRRPQSHKRKQIVDGPPTTDNERETAGLPAVMGPDAADGMDGRPGAIFSPELSIPGYDDTPIVIPPQYARLGAVRGHDPTPVQRLRIWVTGLSGHGKTTFVMNNPKALVLDFEDSARDVVAQKAARETIRDWDHFEQHFDMLRADRAPAPGEPPVHFQHVAFDTFDGFMKLCIRKLSDDYKVDNFLKGVPGVIDGRAAWAELSEFLLGVLARLFEAGYGWTVVGASFEKEIEIDGSKRLMTQSTLPPSTLQPLYRATQLMGHIVATETMDQIPTGKKKKVNTKDGPKTIQETVPQRTRKVRMELEPGKADSMRGPIRDVKGRYLEFLPPEIDLPLRNPFRAFAGIWHNCIQQAVEEDTARAQQQTT